MYRFITTPGMPGSLPVWMPSPLVSFQTKLPILAALVPAAVPVRNMPASMVVSVWPAVNVRVEVSPVLGLGTLCAVCGLRV